MSSSASSASLPACPAWLTAAGGSRSLIDTHVHLADTGAFPAAGMAVLLGSAAAHGVHRIVAVAEDAAEAARCVELSRQFQVVSAGAGVHPVRWSLLPGGPTARAAELAAITSFVEQHHASLVCVGEIGLDYSPWILQQAAAITQQFSSNAASATSSPAPADAAVAASWKSAKDSPADATERAAQLDLFHAQVRLAIRFGLPLNVHSRNASKHAVALLREEGICIGSSRPPVLLHAFDGSLSTMREALRLGYFFSATTSLCRDPHTQQLILQVLTESPLASVDIQSDASDSSATTVWVPSALLHAVLESDSPALHPVKQPPPSAATAADPNGSASCCAAENNTPANLYLALMELHRLYAQAREARMTAERAAAERKQAAANRPRKHPTTAATAAASVPAASSAVASVATKSNAPAAASPACADLSLQQLAALLRRNTHALFPRLQG